MPYRYDMMLQLTTKPVNAQTAIPHTGGWSESHWRNDLIPFVHPNVTRLLQGRAGALPKQASIVGLRICNYTVSGNRLLPGATSITKFLMPGAGYDCDVPQMGLEMGASTNGQNSNRFTLRAIPDAMVVFGEYSPTPEFSRAINEICQNLSGNGWCIQGRVLSNLTYRVVGVTALGVATLNGAPAVAVGDYMRTLRIRDVDGFSIEGAFYVSAVAGNTVTLMGWPADTVVQGSGFMRKDEVNLFPISSVVPSRVVVRKVGRPFEQYRGKRSRKKTRAA